MRTNSSKPNARHLQDALIELSIVVGQASLYHAPSRSPGTLPPATTPSPDGMVTLLRGDRAVALAAMRAAACGATDKQIAGVSGLGRTWARGVVFHGPGAMQYRPLVSA